MENVGIRAVIENAAKAVRDGKEFNKVLEQTNKIVANAQKQAKRGSIVPKQSSKDVNLMQRLGDMLLSRVNPQLSMLSTQSKGAIQQLGSMGVVSSKTTAALGVFAAKALIVVGVLAALTVGFIAFAKAASYGGQLRDQAVAFSNIVGGANEARLALNNMRQATAGTVADSELMRLTTLALQGTSREFREVVAKDMGVVIEASNRVSRATGQSAEVLREKFLLGLRRQSKLLLDDMGVVVDAELAYSSYAASIGVATSALTEQQKQAAFAAEALRQLNVVSQEIGGSNR